MAIKPSNSIQPLNKPFAITANAQMARCGGGSSTSSA